MSDPREDLIERLVAVCQGVTGITRVTRNVLAVEDRDLPAICILDGDEEVLMEAPHGAQYKIELRPQLAIFVRERTATPPGPALSALRALLIKAVTSDATLKTLAGPNGQISYQGIETAYGAARSLKGEAVVRFSMTYVLKPSAL
jgi:hypothetical protein